MYTFETGRLCIPGFWSPISMLHVSNVHAAYAAHLDAAGREWVNPIGGCIHSGVKLLHLKLMTNSGSNLCLKWTFIPSLLVVVGACTLVHACCFLSHTFMLCYVVSHLGQILTPSLQRRSEPSPTTRETEIFLSPSSCGGSWGSLPCADTTSNLCFLNGWGSLSLS